MQFCHIMKTNEIVDKDSFPFTFGFNNFFFYFQFINVGNTCTKEKKITVFNYNINALCITYFLFGRKVKLRNDLNGMYIDSCGKPYGAQQYWSIILLSKWKKTPHVATCM